VQPKTVFNSRDVLSVVDVDKKTTYKALIGDVVEACGTKPTPRKYPFELFVVHSDGSGKKHFSLVFVFCFVLLLVWIVVVNVVVVVVNMFSFDIDCYYFVGNIGCLADIDNMVN
jgi:hypothetical protein